MRLVMKWCAIGLVLLSGTLSLATGVTATLSPAIGPPTTNVQVSGAGFPASTAVDIYFDTTDEVLAVTSATGTFAGIVVKVPASAVPGAHWITAVARGTSGKAAQAAFTVQTNWSQSRYSAPQRGVNPFENVLSPSTLGTLDLDWVFTASAGILMTPVVANGIIYIGSSDGNLYAVNGFTGAQVWTFATGTFLDNDSGLAVANGIVYLGARNGNLYALNATSGVPVWTFTIPASCGTPTVANGTVYFGAANGNYYALNANTGAVLWTAPVGWGGGSPALAGGILYAGSIDHNLYALNASNGTVVWKFLTGGTVGSSPAVSNGTVYFGSLDFNVYALYARSGVLIWKVATGGQLESSPAVANGAVYIGSDDGSLYALSAGNGSLLWKDPLAGFVSAAPEVANGVVYVGASNAAAYGLDTQTGAILWRALTGNEIYRGPIVVNGTVYVVSSDGSLYTFDLAASTMAAKFRPPARPEPASLQPDYTLKPYVRNTNQRR
jgi:outer membrane protein assembly factor BamB